MMVGAFGVAQPLAEKDGGSISFTNIVGMSAIYSSSPKQTRQKIAQEQSRDVPITKQTPFQRITTITTITTKGKGKKKKLKKKSTNL
jgi:hypothetical protein